MRFVAFVVGACASSIAGAQITVPTDPSAYKSDSPAAKPVTPAPPSPARPSPERLDNATVIALVKAGLGPEAVIAKINASTGSYDTSTNSLISMKQTGVPDSVIAAMLMRSQSPVVTNAVADNASPDPLVSHAPGVYLLDRRAYGRMIRIDATVSNQMKTSNLLGYAFTSGIASMKMKTVIPNAAARAQATERRPVFYFYFNQSSALASASQFGNSFSIAATSPNEFSLIRFEQKRDHREATVGSFNIGGMKTGISDKARVPFAYEDVAPGVFKVSPNADLLPGQYGFVISVGAGTGMVSRIFDFSVS